jgi:hypothetical protein
VAAPPDSLETLVRDELRPAIADLVRPLVLELVAEELGRLNGTAASVETPAGVSTPAAEAPSYICSSCGRPRPPGGAECPACRARRRRTQRQAADGGGEDGAGLAAPAG